MCCHGRRKLEWERARQSALVASTAAMQLGSAIAAVTANISSRKAAITTRRFLRVYRPIETGENSAVIENS
jgi:hypothetical protein